MKLFRKLLRYWIAIASVLTFLGGWIILAHSPKPVSPQTTTLQSNGPLNLPPIQAFGSSNLNNSGPSFFSNNNANQSGTLPSSSVPMLRTRGS